CRGHRQSSGRPAEPSRPLPTLPAKRGGELGGLGSQLALPFRGRGRGGAAAPLPTLPAKRGGELGGLPAKRGGELGGLPARRGGELGGLPARRGGELGGLPLALPFRGGVGVGPD